MKKTLKTLGIIFIIVAAVFVTACPGELEPAGYTVSFDSDGGSDVASQTVEEGGTATKPTDPTKSATVEGLYKGSLDSTFVEWQLNGSKYDFSTVVTEDIELKAVWTDATPETLSDGADDIFTKSVTYIKNKAPTSTDKYTLALKNNLTPAKQIVIDTANTDLTIKNIGGQKTITSPDLSGASVTSNANANVFLVIGPSTQPTTTPANNIKLTLVNVAIIGFAGLDDSGNLKADGKEVANSLIRVQYGATLELGDGSAVKGHRSSSVNGSGATGNGAAVCVFGGTLTMKAGSVIEQNESTKDSSIGTGTETNRNRVGGVYTFVPVNTNGTAAYTGATVTLDIQGGVIKNNKCTAGNTKDVYATEGGTFKLSGNVEIEEITINADIPTASSDSPTKSTDTNIAYTSISVSDLGSLADVTVSLRSTAADLTNVKAIWAIGKQVISYGSTGAGAGKVTLGSYKWLKGAAAIDDKELATDGKLAAKTAATN